MKCWKRLARLGSLAPPALYLPLLALLSSSSVPQETTLRTQSNVVLIPALVKDQRDQIVYGLQAKDFVVQDDGVEQSIHLDEAVEAQGISLVIAIQCGRRANREFPRIRGLSSMLEPIVSQGRAKIAIVEFDSHVQDVSNFTGNADQITQDLNDLQTGDGGAAILDAVDHAVKLLEKAPQERQRVLLLISATRDHGSHDAKIDEVVAEIGRSNVVMYALAFSPYISQQLDTAQANNKDEWNGSVDFIAKSMAVREAMRKNMPKTVTTMTGGEYELFATRKKFEVRMNDFTNHLHSRYLLSIVPKNPHPGLHQIRVQLREPGTASVLARTTYWAEGRTE
jgi:VWFA-related protein